MGKATKKKGAKKKAKKRMKKRGTVDIVCIIDRSGSMASIKDDVIGGFNEFIEEQRQVPGKAEVTLAQFDHEYEMVFKRKPLEDVPEYTAATYQPRGSTALLDAIGKTISEFKSKRRDVIVCILTDGFENASQEYTTKAVKAMVEEREKGGWRFVYLGADQDAFAEAGRIGIQVRSTGKFEKTSGGVIGAYAATGQSVTSYRTGK